MKAQDAINQIDEILCTLNAIRDTIDDNDTLTFDVDSKLNKMEELSDEVSEYVDDLT